MSDKEGCFDPLGLITPFSVRAKTLFQTTWCEGLDWDQILPGELANAFRDWVRDLTLLKTWTIPRRYFDSLWSQNPLSPYMHLVMLLKRHTVLVYTL